MKFKMVKRRAGDEAFLCEVKEHGMTVLDFSTTAVPCLFSAEVAQALGYTADPTLEIVDA